MAKPDLHSVWTSRRKTPDGHYVVALGLYAKELLGLQSAERVGNFYIYRTKSWKEVQTIIKKAKSLGLDVRE